MIENMVISSLEVRVGEINFKSLNNYHFQGRSDTEIGVITVTEAAVSVEGCGPLILPLPSTH